MLMFLYRSLIKKQRDFTPSPSFSCSKHIPLVIIYQPHWHKSSFSSVVCVESTSDTSELPAQTRGNCNNMCLLYDINGGGAVAGGRKVMNNSHYFSIWRTTAVLKVNLCFEVVTECRTCVCNRIGATPSVVWCYFGMLRRVSCFVQLGEKIHNYFCWLPARWLRRFSAEKMTLIIVRLFRRRRLWCRAPFDSGRRRWIHQRTSNECCTGTLGVIWRHWGEI